MKTLLVVDDTPEDREVLTRIFSTEPAEYTVIEATDAVSCLEALQAHGSIVCILLDYSMPGRDGLQLLQDLLNQHPQIPILMVTGQGSESIAVDALKLGAQDYVVKNNFADIEIKRRVEMAIEHKHMEHRLERQQQSLRDFTDILVHDLRAPLRSIKGPIERLTGDNTTLSDELQDKLYGFVTDSVEQMDRMILSVQQFSAPQKSEENLEWFCPTRLFDYVQSILAPEIEAKGTDIAFEPSPPKIWGSVHLLRQLLQNLVENAIKYSNRLDARVHVVVIEVGDEWHLVVTDNGMGISVEYLTDIFEPFKRLHSGSHFKGAGLGLATCKRIAEQHDGTIFCESELGCWSKFTLALPKPVLSAH